MERTSRTSRTSSNTHRPPRTTRRGLFNWSAAEIFEDDDLNGFGGLELDIGVRDILVSGEWVMLVDTEASLRCDLTFLKYPYKVS